MTGLLWFSIGVWTAIAVYLLGRLTAMHRHEWTPWADTGKWMESDLHGRGQQQERRCVSCNKRVARVAL